MEKRGFTLLELIVVIIIVGVLAALALPRLFGAINQAKAVEAIQRLGMIDKAVQRCLLGKWYSPMACEPAEDFSNLDIENPFIDGNFTYEGGGGMGSNSIDSFGYYFIVAHKESPGIIILIRREGTDGSMNVGGVINGCPYSINFGNYSPGTHLAGFCGFEPISTR